MKLFIALCSVLTVLVTASCKQNAAPRHSTIVEDLPAEDTTAPRITIKWDKEARKVSHDVYFAEYGRARRISGDTIVMVYHCGREKHEWDNIASRRSVDNGKSWEPAKIIMPDSHPRYFGFSTPDLLVLQNGWLLLAYTGRGIPDDSTHNNLQIRISKDKGETWGDPQILAIGRSWEPGMVQLPDGEIQLFFSNEILSTKRSKNRHEQKVMLMTSRDNGGSWTKPKTVAFTPGRRDGMPVPIVLKDGKGIIFPIEVVNDEKSPHVVWSSIENRWNYPDVATIQNGRRWYAGIDPIWGGAPSIVQLSTGETILAMQTEGGRSIDRYRNWKRNTMLVMVGNSVAKNFRHISRPWPNLPEDQGAYFSSLFLKNDSTMVLITTRTFPDRNTAVYWMEGKVTRERTKEDRLADAD